MNAALSKTGIEDARVGIDWYSGTWPLSEGSTQTHIGECQEALLKVALGGYKLEERYLLGYTGYSAGNCFVGTNADRVFVQFTGYHADNHFDTIHRGFMHVSRIDAQVSIKFHKMPRGVAKKGYRDAIKQNETLSAGRRRKIHIIVGSDGGDTLYVGSPSSDQRGRLYNKEVQSQDVEYERTWRYEVVYKNEYATHVANTAWQRPDKRAAYLLTLVATWFEARGVETPWAFDENLAPAPLIKTLPTDVERKLLWIAEQVRPTVQYLCDAGYRDTLLELLPSLASTEQ